MSKLVKMTFINQTVHNMGLNGIKEVIASSSCADVIRKWYEGFYSGDDFQVIVTDVIPETTLHLSGEEITLIFNNDDDTLQSLQREIAELREQVEVAQFAVRNGESLASDAIHEIRELLKAHDVPIATFIDDHVRNAIVQRNQERDRAEDLTRQLAEARKVLEPFAREAEQISDKSGVPENQISDDVWVSVRLRDCRAAIRALEEQEQGR